MTQTWRTLRTWPTQDEVVATVTARDLLHITAGRPWCTVTLQFEPRHREDASTECEDEEMTLGRQTPRTGKDWSKELPLSIEIPVLVALTNFTVSTMVHMKCYFFMLLGDMPKQ